VGASAATEESWADTLSAIGTVAPVQGVSVSNDAPGVVTRIHFESGALVKQGDILVELDTSVESAQLASSLARSELATQTLERDRKLAAGGAVASAGLDTDESALKTAIADIDGVRAQIARKLVRAPFSGRLGIRTVNMGQYLNPGTTLAVLVGVEAVFVDFSLPQQDLAQIAVGMPVHVAVDGDAAVAGDGAITAVDPTIDSTTRNVKIRAQIPNKEEKLHSGMFAKVEVRLPKRDAVVAIPETALVHASYGDSVFVVEDPKGDEASGGDGRPFKMARQQFVKLGAARGDFVAIVDGVKVGEEVVTAGAFKLRNGSRVIVDNTVSTTPELNPKLQNR
jgi:membrane fusion protein (multidrug efflux system)